MHVPRRNVDRVDELTLVLSKRFLIERVCYFEEISCEIHIQMQRVARRGVVVEPVKDCRGLAFVMQSSEFGRIEKATRALKVKRCEVADPLVSKSERRLLLRRAEGPVHCRNAAERSGHAESRFGDRVDHQTCFIAVFRGGCPGYHFERLNGVDRKLR